MLYVFNKRLPGRPLKCNKETMWGSFQRLVKPMGKIHIDFVGSLQDWSFDALDKIFWNMLVECLQDISRSPPERPNRDTITSTPDDRGATEPAQRRVRMAHRLRGPKEERTIRTRPLYPLEHNRDYDPSINV